MKLVKNDSRVQELQSQLQDGILGLREVKKLLKDYLDKK
jgi:hypothetical protein